MPPPDTGVPASSLPQPVFQPRGVPLIPPRGTSSEAPRFQTPSQAHLLRSLVGWHAGRSRELRWLLVTGVYKTVWTH